MFWVWDKSRAASISSKMYIGAGLKSNRPTHTHTA
jgi:hypothetical protein